jgi:hypothetical protein
VDPLEILTLSDEQASTGMTSIYTGNLSIIKGSCIYFLDDYGMDPSFEVTGNATMSTVGVDSLSIYQAIITGDCTIEF